MKAKIISHEVKEIEHEGNKNIVLTMQYEYKGFKSNVSIIDLEEYPSSKIIKKYIKTAEKAINEEIKKWEEERNQFKKEMKLKQAELDEMRKFVDSRTVNGESLESALKAFKNK